MNTQSIIDAIGALQMLSEGDDPLEKIAERASKQHDTLCAENEQLREQNAELIAALERAGDAITNEDLSQSERLYERMNARAILAKYKE